MYPAELPRTPVVRLVRRRSSTPSSSTPPSTGSRRSKRSSVGPPQAPPGFCYAVKLGQFGSHRKKLADAAAWLPNHLDRLRRLRRGGGPTLVQLPPRWRRNVESPRRVPDRRAARPRLAVELRDPSWLARRRLRRAAPTTVPRCASTTCCPTIRASSRRTGPTCASTGPMPSTTPTEGPYTGRRLLAGRRPSGRLARRRRRHLRLLQQRLRGPSRRRCPLATESPRRGSRCGGSRQADPRRAEALGGFRSFRGPRARPHRVARRCRDAAQRSSSPCHPSSEASP